MRDSVLAAARERVSQGPATAIVIALVDVRGVRYYSIGRRSQAHDAPPADSATIFELASLTKTFTATLLAEAVRRGEVDYDDPVSRYLPDSVRAPTHDGQRITLRQLVTHRSGLARGVRYQQIPDTITPWAQTVARLYDHLPHDSLAFPPGEAFLYSNVGAGLLGHALERRAGVPLEDLLRTRVLVPLGLIDTRATLTPDQRKRLAAGYNRRGNARTQGYPVLIGAAALRSSAADLARYVQAHLGLVHTPLDSALALTRLGQQPERYLPDSLGQGWVRTVSGRRSAYWFAGGNEGYQSFVGFDLERRQGVVILSNSQLQVIQWGLRLLDIVPPPLGG